MSAEYTDDGTLVLNEPVQLPDILDMFIAGAGPAGTAAAFRAKELGLSALIIDHDDLLRRIRDFPKGKEIKPNYGKGDKMKFPKAGKLISLLHFEPSDKDELCDKWKGFYRDHNVPAQIGVEMLGVGEFQDGVWEVNVYNHNTKKDVLYRARHVVLALGGGVPRRFDIPGNTAGIAYGLTDAQKYLGAPACVAGGGTSAAEAVIAISNAKVTADDPTAVYWSYRKEKLPKVSKALAEEFFDAYLGNGNIRYCPTSEPAAVVSADQKEFLSIRVDRKVIEGRPSETSHLEFAKELSIACLGQEVPVKFLSSMGIDMMSATPESKRRMAVTPMLESKQPNVYLIGEILAKRYLEAGDFGADPSSFEETAHAGNIKAAITNGVFVAEVARQKVDGKSEIDVIIEFEEGAAAKPAAAEPIIKTILQKAPASQASVEEAYLLDLSAAGDGEEYTVKSNGVTTIGTKFCDVVFPDDDALAERHASVVHGPEGYMLRDDANTSGVFLKARPGKSMEVSPGMVVRVGKQFLVFGREGTGFSFSHYDQTGRLLKTYPVPAGACVLGRRGDVVLDETDKSLSRRHLSIKLKDGKLCIKDMDSVNGTHIKVDAVTLLNGDEFRMGRQGFRLVTHQEQVVERVHKTMMAKVAPAPQPAAPQPQPAVPQPAPVEPAPAPRPQPAAPPPAPEPAPAAAAAAMVITFKNLDKSFPFTEGQTICDVAEKNGITLEADCHSGVCGGDPIRIISGQENVNPVGDDEKETLEDECAYPPGECRLACMVKPKGTIVVEVLATRNPDA